MDDKEKLVVDNLRLVNFVLEKYVHIPPGMYDDLYQEGCLALCKAAEKYDENVGKFSTFAVSCILSAMKTYFRDNNIVKIPRRLYVKGVPLVVSSIDEDLNEDGFAIADILPDESALDELNYQMLEDTILLEAKRITGTYNQMNTNICLEDLYSRMWGEPVYQTYLADKYKTNQAQVSRILRKFYKELKSRVEGG